MTYLIEYFGIFGGWLASTLSVLIRYGIMAGLAFGLFYKLWRSEYWQRKIQQKLPQQHQIWNEILHSLLTAIVFAFIGLGIYFQKEAGYTQIYTDVSQFGWGYLLLSVIVLIFIHDAYFYWLHRLMHHPRLFQWVHRVHHQSFNPTPWASLSFHPLEAILEVAIVPVVLVFIPMHPIALLLFSFWSLSWNVIGHLGFELFPKGFVHHPIFKWLNTSTHHNMHHHRSGCNYGLYFNFWDTWMGTNHKNYKDVFDQITNRDERKTKEKSPKIATSNKAWS